MAKTSAAAALLASAASAAGSTRASPGRTSSTFDNTAGYGAAIGYKITNGGSAPGVAITLEFQSSHDGTSWYTYYLVGGDTVVSSENSGTIKLDRDIRYLRAITYGNTTNAVTVEVYLQATSGV